MRGVLADDGSAGRAELPGVGEHQPGSNSASAPTRETSRAARLALLRDAGLAITVVTHTLTGPASVASGRAAVRDSPGSRPAGLGATGAPGGLGRTARQAWPA